MTPTAWTLLDGLARAHSHQSDHLKKQASTLIRGAAADTSVDKKWVVFDGPVDAIWIESMNTGETSDDGELFRSKKVEDMAKPGAPSPLLSSE